METYLQVRHNGTSNSFKSKKIFIIRCGWITFTTLLCLNNSNLLTRFTGVHTYLRRPQFLDRLRHEALLLRITNDEGEEDVADWRLVQVLPRKSITCKINVFNALEVWYGKSHPKAWREKLWTQRPWSFAKARSYEPPSPRQVNDIIHNIHFMMVAKFFLLEIWREPSQFLNFMFLALEGLVS